MMRVGQHSYSESFEVTYVLEQELARVLVESLIVVAEETVLNHFLFVALPEELHNLVGVAHSQRLRLFQ